MGKEEVPASIAPKGFQAQERFIPFLSPVLAWSLEAALSLSTGRIDRPTANRFPASPSGNDNPRAALVLLKIIHFLLHDFVPSLPRASFIGVDDHRSFAIADAIGARDRVIPPWFSLRLCASVKSVPVERRAEKTTSHRRLQTPVVILDEVARRATARVVQKEVNYFQEHRFTRISCRHSRGATSSRMTTGLQSPMRSEQDGHSPVVFSASLRLGGEIGSRRDQFPSVVRGARHIIAKNFLLGSALTMRFFRG